MLRTTNAYSSFAAKDLAAEKRFFTDTLGLKVEEPFDDQLLQLDLSDDKHVMIYAKPDFTPATFTVLNFPVPDVDAAVDELTRSGVEMARFEGFDQDEKGIARPGADGGPTIAWFRDPAGNILAVHDEAGM
jgi:predicted enzyme related to lactoylglutathione lyase